MLWLAVEKFHGLEMFLSNILIIYLFCSNNRITISSKTEKKPYHSIHWKDHTFMTSIWMGDSHMEGLKICYMFVTYLQFLLFLNKRSVVHFSRWRVWGIGRGGPKNWSFFVDVRNVWLLNGLKLQLGQSLEPVAFSSTSSHKPETLWLCREQPQAPIIHPILCWWPNQSA